VPLFYDAFNECGLAIAALSFPKCAVYLPAHEGYINLGSFELIPYILGECGSVDDAKKSLSRINLTGDSFSGAYRSTPLHFMIADRERSIVVEPCEDGLEIYDAEVGVMTNAPGYGYHLSRLTEYFNLSNRQPEGPSDREPYSRGMGAVGLPGDWSSASRFIRCDFVKRHISSEKDPVPRFFRVADTVEVPRGCVLTIDGEEVSTAYTSCMALDDLTYNYRTYEDRCIRSFKL
jgi:choloylglycine hydrolase